MRAGVDDRGEHAGTAGPASGEHAGTAGPATRSRAARVVAWRASRPPLVEIMALGLAITVCLGLTVGLVG